MDNEQRKFKNFYDFQRKGYASVWTANAEAHQTNMDYEWMSNLVAGFPYILEIGCGTGHSTLALAKAGHRIISIEENPNCVRAAEQLLRANGIKVKVIKRERNLLFLGEIAKMEYSTLHDAPPTDGVLLLEGDIKWDENLLKWLTEKALPFDGIVCWLIAGHGAKAQTPTAQKDYRLTIQNQTYDLADKFLRVGGRLSIVDRGEAPTQQFLIDDTLKSHGEQAATTSLKVGEVTYKVIPAPVSKGTIPMVMNLGSSGRKPDVNFEYALISIVSEKPSTPLPGEKTS